MWKDGDVPELVNCTDYENILCRVEKAMIEEL